MWRLPKPALGVIIAVEIVTVGVTIATATWFPMHRSQWIIFGILAACSVAHLEAVRGIERIREGARPNAPYVDLKSVWTFAAVLLLPPILAAALVVFTYVHMRRRVARQQIFRIVYSTCTVVLATEIAGAILYAGMPAGSYPGLPTAWRGVAVIVVAALMRWFINHGLVVTAILLSSPNTPGKEALGSFSDNIVECAAVSLGAVTALVVSHDPWYVVLVLLPMLVLHRSLLLRQYEVAARTDAKTGLANAMHWSQMARAEIARAERDSTSVGILMLDLDFFKKINDNYGHLTGDVVLKAVADALKREARDYDLVGRFGGEEFLILLPGLNPADLALTAERFRQRASDLTVISPDTNEFVSATASAGAVSFPADGQDLDELLLTVDAALYRAKEGGRNQTCFASAEHRLPPRRELSTLPIPPARGDRVDAVDTEVPEARTSGE